MGKSCEQVYHVDDLVAHTAGGNFARPANGEWRTQRGLHCGEIGTPPRAAVAFPGVSSLGAVVAGEDDDRAGFLDGVENLPCAMVHFGETIRPIAVPSLTCELGIRQCWHVKEGERDIGEKWFAAARVSFYEFDGARGDFLFHGPPMIQIQLGDLARLLTFARFINGLSGNQMRVPALL